VSQALEQVKQPVSATLAGPYGHPWHPVVVTVPIGAWVASLAFDIGSHLVAGPGFLAQGSQWLIAIGVIGALAAALLGLLDFSAIPTGTRAYRTGMAHMSLNLLIIVGYLVNFFWRQPSYRHPAPVAAGPLALSAASLAVLTVSGFLGGKLAYRYGVRVAAETTQAEGYQPPR
jgi:uncharacterized membrane protein